MKAWSRQFTLEFIDTLRSLQWMWDMQHAEYRSPGARRRGYDLLVAKAREVDPSATIGDVKRKIKGLRTNLKKIERRVLDYRRLNLEYTPSLFYYEPLSFLLTQVRPLANKSRRSSSEGSVQEHTEEVEDMETVSSNDDECEVFGQYVAAKLLSIAKLQRIYLEKIINDAIYQAELGNLTASTRLFKEETFDNGQNSIMVDMSGTGDRLTGNVVMMSDHEGNEIEHREGMMMQEVVFDPQYQDDQNQINNIEDHKPVVDKDNWQDNQIVDDNAGQIFLHRQSSERNGQTHYILERVHAGPEASSPVVAERIHPLPAGAILERIDDRIHITAPNEVVSDKGTDKIHVSSRNGLITVENKKVMNDAMLAGRSVVIENGAIIEAVKPRQGVIVEKVQMESGLKRYVVKEPVQGPAVMKNVQFADDDIMKMCQDDGITIICVQDNENAAVS